MSGSAPAAASAEHKEAEQHEEDVEHREAYQYWGYLFKPDKTGTDKLKSLLRGLKDLMNEYYEPSDNPDLTPTQLASYYRELHGNYDQLFLGTPSESIAFIYKSLGCLHSLQPLSHSTAFTDPSVPSLKTEGWIMWQTIQLLLGPEEHSGFLTEAVQRWDVKDPATGEVFPKILPRQCFPLEPDKHMVAWYEGVSERLRREAEDEERRHDLEAEQAEVRRIHQKKGDDTDDEGSVDSRGPALAYFRNPLYRHVDGRPTIVRQNSKRPAVSPRPTMLGKGKEAAATMGHVIRNIGSPHLWDGGHPNKPHSHSRDRDRDHRRRSSLPNNRYYQQADTPPSAGYDSKLSAGHDQQRRRRSGQLDRPPTSDPGTEDELPGPSPRPGGHHHHRSEDRDASLRHSRSHEPTPSQKEVPDYFYGYDHASRRNSAYGSTGTTPPPAPNGVGPGFGPSASPLFASNLPKQPQPPPRMAPPPEQYGPPRKAPSVRRAQERPYSRSPDPGQRPRDREDRHSHSHRYSSHDRRPRFEQPNYDDGPPPGPTRDSRHHPMGPSPSEGGRSGNGPFMPPSGGYPPTGPLPNRDRRSGRMSGSDVSGAEDRDDRRSGRKKTRFAAGVDGRRYPNESGWR
ncbi:hypothetical protein LTR37_000278 [Vermiconidia calcicola]|uniref:Uncharacterized protein n=1 Tax=Vermiconidia calcicola TaxID=1690605 RepID=A0ACC3NZD6_9PEZI|nr:hypothetical protein LTR37_000278 [Vermiconidia calcicola]